MRTVLPRTQLQTDHYPRRGESRRDGAQRLLDPLMLKMRLPFRDARAEILCHHLESLCSRGSTRTPLVTTPPPSLTIFLIIVAPSRRVSFPLLDRITLVPTDMGILKETDSRTRLQTFGRTFVLHHHSRRRLITVVSNVQTLRPCTTLPSPRQVDTRIPIPIAYVELNLNLNPNRLSIFRIGSITQLGTRTI